MIFKHLVLQTRILKNSLLLFCCCFFTTYTFCQRSTKEIAGNNVAVADSSSSPRQIIPFDDNWHFLLGDDAAAKEAAFDDSQWRLLNLPHDWSIEGPLNPPPSGDKNTGYFIHGIGWYRAFLR